MLNNFIPLVSYRKTSPLHRRRLGIVTDLDGFDLGGHLRQAKVNALREPRKGGDIAVSGQEFNPFPHSGTFGRVLRRGEL